MKYIAKSNLYTYRFRFRSPSNTKNITIIQLKTPKTKKRGYQISNPSIRLLPSRCSLYAL